jgi:hypothetical protein
MWRYLGLLALGTSLWAQDPRIDQIPNNMGKVVVTLKLDREVYFPGELGNLTITVQNPTAQDLVIWKPFESETGAVVLLQKAGVSARARGTEYGPVSPDPYVINISTISEQPLPTAIIRSGEQLGKTAQFFDRILGRTPESMLLLTGSAPPQAGDFRVEYWGQSADFQVVAPVFEGSAKIELTDFEEVSVADAAPTRVRLRAYAFVLGYGGKHFICVERLPYPHDAGEIIKDQEGRVTDLGLPFRRYTRFAETDEPIRSLRGTSDAAGDLVLIWEQGGSERRLNLARTDWHIASLQFGK